MANESCTRVDFYSSSLFNTTFTIGSNLLESLFLSSPILFFIMSTHNPTHGTKVTTDPAGKENPVVEAAGAITSDSLAAESVTSHGKFADNRDSAPSSVPAKSSTASNADTSAATVLPPARDADRRESAGEDLPTHKPTHADLRKHHQANAPSDLAAQSAPKSTHHQTDTHHQKNKTAADKQEGNMEHGHVPVAPSYVHTGHAATDDPHNKPHGKGLTEVQDFEDGEGKNASFGTDIGGKDDPGRVAEEAFERANAVPGFEAGPRQKGVEGEGRYDALKTDD